MIILSNKNDRFKYVIIIYFLSYQIEFRENFKAFYQ